MNQEEDLLSKETIKEEPKKSSGNSWVSLLLSAFFIVRGVMYISEGTTVWGGIMLLFGLVGLVWKLYDMNKNKEA